MVRSGCQRCQRLAKECSFQEDARGIKRSRSDVADAPQNDKIGAERGNGVDARVFSTLYRTPAPSEPSRASQGVSAALSELLVAQKATFLSAFRLHNPHLPFLVLPGDLDDPTGFEEQAPFTFAACIAVAAHRHPVLQRRLSRDMHRYMAEAMFVEGVKSLDLFTGLSILTSWYIPHP